MNYEAYLAAFKAGLKKSLSENLEETLESLFGILAAGSPLYNELVQLEGQFNQVESEARKGVIDYEFRMLQLNRIRDKAMGLIDNITYPGLNGDWSEELAAHQKAYLRGVTPGEAPAQEPATEATPVTVASLELFTEQNRRALAHYPRVYRSLRALIFRGLDANPENARAYQAVAGKLEGLKRYAELLRPMEEQMKQIRLNPDNRQHWIRFKEFSKAASEAELETLGTVIEKLPALEAFHQALAEQGLM